MLHIIPKDKSSLKAFIIVVFNKVHKSHEKTSRPIPKSPRSAPCNYGGGRHPKKQEGHVSNQIKKQDNKAFVQRNEKPDQSGTVGQTNDSGFKEKNEDRNDVCSQER